MRIIAGDFRGRALAGVGKGDEAAHLRPTTDRIRESIFNILTGGRHGDVITDSRVLDLFAGTGAMGLEALSRGATFATFVDNGRTAARLIERNIELCQVRPRSQCLRFDATRPSRNPGPPCTLIFIDPPYGRGLGPLSLEKADGEGWVGDDALIVIEDLSEIPAMPGFEKVDHRRFGSTHVTFFRKDAAE